MNELHSNEHQDDPDRNIEQPPAAIESRSPAINNPASSSDGKKKEKHWPQRIEAVCAVMLVLITGTYTYYTRGQLRLTREAVRQSKADNAAAIAAQQKLAQDSLIKSQENFDKSASDARDAFRDDQRAWVGPISITAPEVKAGSPIPTIGIVIKNSGKTPALRFASNITMRVFRKNEPFRPIFTSPTGPPSIDVVQPNMGMLLNTGAAKTPLTDTDITAFHNREFFIYFFGKLTYVDAFKRIHHTTFCVFYDPVTLKEMQSCNAYNTAD
jgi:hypothetical protein